MFWGQACPPLVGICLNNKKCLKNLRAHNAKKLALYRSMFMPPKQCVSILFWVLVQSIIVLVWVKGVLERPACILAHIPVCMAQFRNRGASLSTSQPCRAACIHGIWKIFFSYKYGHNEQNTLWHAMFTVCLCVWVCALVCAGVLSKYQMHSK